MIVNNSFVYLLHKKYCLSDMLKLEIFVFMRRVMAKVMEFDASFNSLEKAMEYAGNHDHQAIITNDYVEFYVVNCDELDHYLRLGFDYV